MNTAAKQHLYQYHEILRNYVDGKVTAKKFEQLFLAHHSKDHYLYEEGTGIILSKIFTAVDSFCDNPEIANYNRNDPLHDIDAAQLLSIIKELLTLLEKRMAL